MNRHEAILRHKSLLRSRMLGTLEQYRDPRSHGFLAGCDGKPLTTLPSQVPVFITTGRLDPAQKGADVAARAVEHYLGQNDGRFLFAMMPANAPGEFVDDLIHLTEHYPGKVMYCGFRMRQGWRESLAGATFSIWPSLYEPYGGVGEFLLSGTPIVAHGTGGLRQQVVDIEEDPQKGNGIVYSASEPADRQGWQAILDAPTPADRMRSEAYRGQVSALAAALERARRIFAEDLDLYARMLGNLYDSVKPYSWERNYRETSAVYDQATSTWDA